MRGRTGRIVWSIAVVGIAASVLPAQAALRTTALGALGQSSWIQALWAAPTSGFTATSEYRDGTFVHTDHVFDDKGADVSGAAGGDFTYPAEGAPYMRNAADLVEVRLRPDGDALSLGVRLNTVLDSDVPVAAVGIVDPAGSLADEARVWPGAGVRATGVRWVATLGAGGAVVTDLRSGATATFPLVLSNDTETAQRQHENTLSTRLPLSAFGFTTMPDSLRLHAVVGIRDGDGWHRPDQTAPAPFDLAFVKDEQWENWQQNRQSDLLASADISAAGELVDLTVRNSGVPVHPGPQSRIYRSSIEQRTGEGITQKRFPLVTGAEDTAAAPLGDLYLGLFLPYALHVPKDFAQLPKPVPAFLALHGFMETHQSTLFGHWVSGDLTVPAIAISPLGRGQSGYYQGAAALDVFEVLDDAKAAFPIDDSRVFNSGSSMGGIGTYTLGMLRPDLFAAAIPISGPGSGQRDFVYPVPAEPVLGPGRDVVQIYRLGSFGRETLDNALNLPFRIFQGAVDNISSSTFAEGDVDRWEELGYDYQYALFLTRGHEVVPAYINALYHQVLHGCTAATSAPGCDKGLGEGRGITRDANPARVVYKSVPFHSYPELGLVFDGAYWVSDMQVRTRTNADSFGRIDATSLALANTLRAQQKQIGRELRTFEPTGDDLTFQARLWGSAPQSAEPGRASVTLENLSAVTLDMTRMGIDVSSPVTIDATGDGQTAVTFTGPWRDGTSVAVTRDGAALTTLVSGAGALRLPADFSGTHRYLLTPAAAPPPPRDNPPHAVDGQLPATGGLGLPLLALTVMTCAAAVLRKRHV